MDSNEFVKRINDAVAAARSMDAKLLKSRLRPFEGFSRKDKSVIAALLASNVAHASRDRKVGLRETLVKIVRFCGSVNVKNADGETILYEACKYSLWDCIKALIALGASPNLTTPEGRTPLHALCETTRRGGQTLFEECATMLVKNGADVDARDHDGKTPLHVMVANEWQWLDEKDVFFMCSKLKADPTTKDDSGTTIIDAARTLIVKEALKLAAVERMGNGVLPND